MQIYTIIWNPETFQEEIRGHKLEVVSKFFSKKAIVHTFATVMDYHVFSVWAWIKVKFWLFEPHLFLLILL